jgi:hypothetical protein|nr:MAG TPA: hypothetical protein [Caudoviricetes sp.]
MATTRETLKKWFSRGAYPSAGQFAAWIDAFFHKDDKIPAASVEGLTDTLNAKADAETVDSMKKKQEEDTDRIGDLETATGELQPETIEVERYGDDGEVFFLTPMSEIEGTLKRVTERRKSLFVIGAGGRSPASMSSENGALFVLSFTGADGRFHEMTLETQPDAFKLIRQRAYRFSEFITSTGYSDTTDYKEI